MAKVDHHINVYFNLGLTSESLMVLKNSVSHLPSRWFCLSPTHHINNGYIWKIGWSGQKDPSGVSTLKADLWNHWKKNAISERIPTHCVCWAVRMTAWAQIWRLHFGFVAFLSTCILYSLQQSASFVQKFWGNAKKNFFSSSSFRFSIFFNPAYRATSTLHPASYYYWAVKSYKSCVYSRKWGCSDAN